VGRTTFDPYFSGAGCVGMILMPHTHDNHNPQDSFYDEDEVMPLAEFDYRSIQAVVLEPERKHSMYGHTYSEYRQYRSRTVDPDIDKKSTQITFYCDPIIKALVPTLARRRNISTYAYIADMLEEGQIHFHPDHHETYEAVNNILDDLQMRIRNHAQSRAVQRIVNLKISLGVVSKQSKRFAPRIPSWLSDDINSVATDLHSTQSDIAYVYLLTGIIFADAIEMPLIGFHDEVIASTLSIFDQDLEAMKDTCEFIASSFENLI
jgi:hypothetical protein